MPDPKPRRSGAVPALVIAGLVFGAIAASPLYLPAARSDQDKLNDRVVVGVQRVASRLASVNANLAALADLRQQLSDHDVKLTADAMADAARDSVEAAKELEQLLSATARALGEVQRKYPGIGVGQPAPGGLGGASGLSSAAKSTFPSLQKLLTENDASLKAADREIKELLTLSVGQARAQDDPVVNQLAAILAYQQGLLAANRADLLRRMASDDFGVASSLLTTALQGRRALTAIESRTPDALVRALEQRQSAATEIRGKMAAALEQLERSISKLESEANQLRRDSDEARRQMHQMDSDHGRGAAAVVSISDHRRQYADLAVRARQADARADAIEYGTLVGGRVELPPDGDLLRAAYVDGRPAPGLVTLRAQRDSLKADLEAVDRSLDAVKAQLESTMAAGDDLRRQRDAVQDLVDQAVATADQFVSRAEQRVKAARGEEDKALAAFEDAGRKASAAVSAAQRRAQRAREANAKNPPDKPNQPLKELADDKDREAASRFLAAQVSAAAADVLLQRMRALESVASLSRMRASLVGREPEPTSDEAVAEARTRGVALAEKAAKELTDADKLVGGNYSYTIGATRVQGSAYRWQFQATAAGVQILLAQFAESAEQRAEFMERANQLLTEAAKGREGSPLLSSAVDAVLYLQRSAEQE